MPFLVITGEFVPEAGHPDGDSIRFRPDTPSLLYRLTRRGRPHKLSPTTGTVQLRFEGIDTMEKAANAEFANSATSANLALCGVPDGTGTAKGYICSNQLGPNGRPIAFVFAGNNPPRADGDSVFLKPEDMAQSVNGKQLAKGHAYPLFYDTLYHDLRGAMTELMQTARMAGEGVWAEDASGTGAIYTGAASLKTMKPLFPKLWRRLDHYSRDRDVEDPETLNELPQFLEYDRPDRVLVINKVWQTGFHNLIEVQGNKVSINEAVHNLVFTS